MSFPSDQDIANLWPAKGEISIIHLSDRPDDYFAVGHGVDRIEKTAKAGEHAFIPYVRVHLTDGTTAEFCQHRLHAVYFK
jgi:hypothetical protein